MRKTILAGLLALGILGTVGVPAARSLTKDDEVVVRAVAQGVAALKALQGKDGNWPDPDRQLGATALAGITLIECKVDLNDQSVAAAAAYVRKECVACDRTYSIALAIIFLDLIGNPADVPLMESLGVRLLAGQSGTGGWGYTCPKIPDGELQRLLALGRTGGTTELKTRRPGAEGGKRAPARDLSPEIKQQLAQLAAAAGGGGGGDGDNSNTQFATLAMWVCRRISLPVEGALGRVEGRFRGTQGEDGGWGYTLKQMRMPALPPGANVPPEMRAMMAGSSTPTMTCAGALGLLVAHGVLADMAREKRVKPREYDKDPQLMAALTALGTACGEPIGDRKDIQPPQAAGKSYYFLWSLERVCVALELEKLMGKDWYTWGAEILIANQRGGGWQGEYASSGADTCFALLFLVKANLLSDLHVKGKAETSLRAGGLGGGGIRKPPPGLKGGIEGNARPNTRPTETNPVATRPTEPRPAVSIPPDAPPLAAELLRAGSGAEGAVLQKLQDSKGVEHTEALAYAIPRLDGDMKVRARDALTARLTRLKAESLGKYLADEDAEIRRAAALACAAKGVKASIPKLIPLLRDSNQGVVKAAHEALKELSGQNLGTAPAGWEAWWAKQGN